MISIHAEPSFERLRYFLGGDRPSQTARLTVSPDQIHGRRLETQQSKGGIPRVTPQCLTAREAALRAGKVLRREVSAEVCGTLPFPSCEARSFTAAPLPLHIAPARSFTLRSAQTFMKKQSVPVTAGPDAAYRFRNPRRRNRPADSVWYMGRIQNA